MRYSKILVCAICLIGVFMFNGTAKSGIAWYGFTDLYGEAEFTQVPAGSYLTVEIYDAVVNVWCYNPNSNDSANWVLGTGNGGNIIETVVLEGVDASKIKKLVTAEISILLDKYDNPIEAGEEFVNICHPNGDSKDPVTDSAYMDTFKVKYYLYKSDIEKPSLLGYQECSYYPDYDNYLNRDNPMPEPGVRLECTTLEGKPNEFD